MYQQPNHTGRPRGSHVPAFFLLDELFPVPDDPWHGHELLTTEFLVRARRLVGEYAEYDFCTPEQGTACWLVINAIDILLSGFPGHEDQLDHFGINESHIAFLMRKISADHREKEAERLRQAMARDPDRAEAILASNARRREICRQFASSLNARLTAPGRK